MRLNHLLQVAQFFSGRAEIQTQSRLTIRQIISQFFLHTLLLALGALTLTQNLKKKKKMEEMWNQFVSQGCGLAGVSRRHPRSLAIPESLERPLIQSSTLLWVHVWVDMLGGSQRLRLQEENAVQVTGWKQKCYSPRGFDLQSSFCKEWEFFFSKSTGLH